MQFTDKTLERVTEELEYDVKHFETAKATFLDKFETNPNYAFTWKATEVMAAQAAYEVAYNLLPSDQHVEGYTLAKGLNHFMETVGRNMADYIRVGTGSTSDMSNLVEDAVNGAKLTLYSRVCDLVERQDD